MSNLYVAQMRDGVFEADSLLELKRQMAGHYFQDSVDSLDVESVDCIDEHDVVSVIYSGRSADVFAGEIMRMIATMNSQHSEYVSHIRTESNPSIYL